jgi:hypothetical protein
LRHIRIIACRIGTVVPGIGRVGLAIIVVSIVRIIAPGISERSAEEEPVTVKSIPVKPAKSPAVETATVETAAMKAAKSAAVEAPATAAVEASATAMRPSVGEIWLAERGSAQQSSCGCQSPSYPGAGSRFA